MGRTSAVISASTLRRLSRTHRAVMTGMLARAGAGRAARNAGTSMAVSDTGDLLVSAAVAPGVDGLGRLAGQGEKHVVEGGAADAEFLYRHPARIELIEQPPYVHGTSVGGDADQQLASVGRHDPPGGGAFTAVERVPAGEDQLHGLA